MGSVRSYTNIKPFQSKIRFLDQISFAGVQLYWGVFYTVLWGNMYETGFALKDVKWNIKLNYKGDDSKISLSKREKMRNSTKTIISFS